MVSYVQYIAYIIGFSHSPSFITYIISLIYLSIGLYVAEWSIAPVMPCPP